MISYRGWAVLIILALMALGISQSRAAPTFRRQAPTQTCAAVREFVAMVGAAEAEKVARNAGASDAQIAAAKRCLK